MQADLFNEREDWRRPLALSAGFHLLLALTIVIVGFFHRSSGPQWGGGTSGDAVNADLVSSVPLPPAQTQTNNILANPSIGVTHSQPQPRVETEDGISIPERNAKKRIEKTPTPPPQPPRPQPRPATPPVEDTAVPFGEGGPVSGPYGVFTAPNTKGGFNFQSGDFGSRFAWYVDVVRRKVRENWPYQLNAQSDTRRVYISFDILRNGTPTNIQLEQSSGVPALDQTAMRAIQRIDSFGALPGDYSGSKVSVEFWFDYH